MRLLGVLFLSGIFLSLAFEVSSKAPEGVMNCEAHEQAKCDGFWDRQPAAAKKFMSSFPVGDRNAALTCYALHGYGKVTKKLRECTHSLIGDRRSMAHCEKRGHDLMSEAMEKCQMAYRRKNNYPLPY